VTFGLSLEGTKDGFRRPIHKGMAVDAVSIELLSAVFFPRTGKNTGNVGDFGLETPEGIDRIAVYPGQLSNSLLDWAL
jgi:hypothetical protein